MNSAVIYARYSSDRQTEQSIEGQLSVCNDYAKRNDIVITGMYIDRALTGRSDDRPEFQRMIKESKSHGFDIVLVYKFDRFSRDRYDSLYYERELKKNGVKIISATEAISDDPQGILLKSIIDGYSEYYSAELAQKVK
nr:recombinase family protein [Acholeplasmatales bacterium]